KMQYTPVSAFSFASPLLRGQGPGVQEALRPSRLAHYVFSRPALEQLHATPHFPLRSSHADRSVPFSCISDNVQGVVAARQRALELTGLGGPSLGTLKRLPRKAPAAIKIADEISTSPYAEARSLRLA